MVRVFEDPSKNTKVSQVRRDLLGVFEEIYKILSIFFYEY